MAESGILLPGSSYTLRSFLNTIGGQAREHQGVVLTDSVGNIIDTLGTTETPTTTTRGLVVAPVRPNRAAYQINTPEITTATLTIGTKEALTIYKPAAMSKEVRILEIGANIRVFNTAGTWGWDLQFFTAENATPGGTAIVPQPLRRSDPASGLTVRTVPAAPTVTGSVFQRAYFPLPAAAAPMPIGIEGMTIFRSIDADMSDAIILRGGVAEGLRISQTVVAALTGAPVYNLWVKFLEF